MDDLDISTPGPALENLAYRLNNTGRRPAAPWAAQAFVRAAQEYRKAGMPARAEDCLARAWEVVYVWEV